MKINYGYKISFTLMILFNLVVSGFFLFSPTSDVHTATSLPDSAVNTSGTVNMEDKTVSKEMELTILHTNDTHAHLENIPRRFTAIYQIRNSRENSLLLDAGDVFSGPFHYNQYLGQADIQFMNEIGYDTMTFGNHEFDKNSEILRNFITAAAFPFVSANINLSKDEKLKNLSQLEIGNPGTNGMIYPAVIKEMDGQKIGIVGLTTEKTTLLARPNKNIVFENAIEKAKEMIGFLEGEDINKIIVISHLGYDKDKELAKNVEGIDVIVGSHSHTKLRQPDIYNEEKEPTLIVQASKHGRYLGQLDVSFDAQGKLIKWNGKLINVMKKDQTGNYLYREDEWAKNRLGRLNTPIDD